MPDQKKTKQQLIDELAECRQRVAELEAADAERESAEPAPTVSAEWFQSLLSSLNDVVWAASADGSEYLYINEAAERVYGRPISEFFENPDIWAEVVHPEDAERVWRESQDLLEQGSTESEYRIVRPDGEERWLHDRKIVISDDDGNPIRIGGIATDVTAHKQAEAALRFEWERLLTIFDGIDQAIYVADPETYEILYVNKALRDAFQSDLVGGICYSEFQGFDAPCEFCTNEIILKEKGKPYHWEYHNPILDRHYEIVDRIIQWPDGRDVRFELAIDITERKRAHEALAQQTQEILEVSTPVMQVWKGVVVAPLIGTLDSQRTQRFMEVLLESIMQTESDVALVDITGVPTIDTQTAYNLIETISAVRLLGAQVVLTGVRPAIAQTLVHLGVDLSGIITRSSLVAGLRVALDLLGLQVVSKTKT